MIALNAANAAPRNDRRVERQILLPRGMRRKLLEAQGGLCAICERPETVVDSRNGNVKELAGDHCHSTLEVRGMCCQRCNQGLGSFRDDRSVMLRAVAYLDDPPARKILGDDRFLRAAADYVERHGEL